MDAKTKDREVARLRLSPDFRNNLAERRLGLFGNGRFNNRLALRRTLKASDRNKRQGKGEC
jgi:hypothetical protein